MKQYLANTNKYKPLLYELVMRNLKNRYRKSILGVFWTLLNPLLMMVVLSIVFSSIFKFDIEHYPIYILSGQVIFNFFSECTSSGMMSVLSNAPLIKKIYVPKYMFTISTILSSIINVMASFAALVLVMLAMGMDFKYTMLLSFIPILLVIIISSGVGFFLASFTVKFRDIEHFYSVFLTAFMYLMPVIYPMKVLESRPIVYNIVAYNPLTMILEMFRGLVLDGVLPDPITTAILFLISILILAIGIFTFYKKQDSFIMDI